MENPISSDLIARYSTRVPRYTSYPTAVEFSPAMNASHWREELVDYQKTSPSSPLALYCHIPFCRSLCYFCACNKTIAKDRSEVAPYLAALKSEIACYRSLLGPERPVVQMHWGGGSPNFLTPIELEQLTRLFRESFPHFTSDADVSIELDPRTTDLEQLQSLKRAGFNRISLGVQDFDPQVQEAVHRIQSFEATASLISQARQLGFSSINVDLIYGLPYQTAKSFSRTLSQVRELMPDRIALYGYAHVTWVTKVQKVFAAAPLPSPDERVGLLASAIDSLSEAGYCYIGMDHFALPEDGLSKAWREGSLHRNFMGYATHRTDALIGVGVSAISSLPSAFGQNDRTINGYLERVASGHFPVEKGIRLTSDDRWRGVLISRLMCEGMVDLRSFEVEHGLPLEEASPVDPDLLRRLRDDELITNTDGRITVTPRGRFFLRTIASAFDAHLARHTNETVYSQAM